MPRNPADTYSMILSIGVGVVAALLAVWQWVEYRRREVVESAEDNRHFRRQEIRRAIVASIMAVLAVGIFAGTRIETKVAGRPNLLFVEIWIGIFALVMVLLILAMMDWIATRRYAGRKRSAIVREGIEIIQDEFRLRASSQAPTFDDDIDDRNGYASSQFS